MTVSTRGNHLQAAMDQLEKAAEEDLPELGEWRVQIALAHIRAADVSNANV